MITNIEMEQAAQMFCGELTFDVILMQQALERALTIIHGPMTESTEISDIDPDTLFDERWQLSALRQYDRADNMMWTFSASVNKDANDRSSVTNSVSAKAATYRAAAYAALIRAAVLFETLNAPQPEEKVAA